MGGIKLEIVDRMPGHTRHTRRARPRPGYTRRGTLFRGNPVSIRHTIRRLPGYNRNYYTRILPTISSYHHPIRNFRIPKYLGPLRGGTRKNRRSNKN